MIPRGKRKERVKEKGHDPKRLRMCKMKNGRSKDVSMLALRLASVLSG